MNFNSISCKNCKWYIKKSPVASLNDCGKFKYTKNGVRIHEYAKKCREDIELCGPDALYFENKFKETIIYKEEEDDFFKSIFR